jgi:hypothetical protein
LRSILAVVAGFVLIGLLGFVMDTLLQQAGVFPETGIVKFEDWQSALALSYHLLFTLAGAYLTAWLAPDRPVAHAIALGIAGILFSILGLIAIVSGDLSPVWYGWALILLSVPVTWAGGKLFLQRQMK